MQRSVPENGVLNSWGASGVISRKKPYVKFQPDLISSFREKVEQAEILYLATSSRVCIVLGIILIL